MPSFTITVDGQAISQIPSDRAAIKVEVSAKGKTAEQAKANLAAKTAGFEAIVLCNVLGKRTGSNPDVDGADFVLLTEDIISDPLEELFPPGQCLRRSSIDTDLKQPVPTRAQIDAQEHIDSWSKSNVSVLDTGRFKTTTRKGKKIKRADNNVHPIYTSYQPQPPADFWGGLDMPASTGPWVPEHTAKNTYTITFLDATAIDYLDLDKLDCKLFRRSLRLLPETKQAAKAELRVLAAANALRQAQDYCKGLLCNSATTRISPIDFGTAASIRREERLRDRSRSRSRTRNNRYSSPTRSFSTVSSVSDFDDFDERPGCGSQRNMVELEHRVEVTFRIDTDELILMNIA